MYILGWLCFSSQVSILKQDLVLLQRYRNLKIRNFCKIKVPINEYLVV